ncbi:hypothetical protein QVD17_19775 [Tagetes erecta]|uniref:Uncharacterized protein n=1 Tax=Tagetes erecta TaxID=13708 RepID=A0AAD8KK23_TARER|nr:hypothetical protein QVD17_19775 [Tagetes erecta]
MGSTLCCMKESPSTSPIKKSTRERKRFINNLTQNSSKNVVVRYKEGERKQIRRSSTLKECLLASPSNHNHALNPTRIQVYNSDLTPSPQIMRTTEVRTEDLRASKISEKLNRKVDEDDDSRFAHMLDRSESQKSKKKVSFRFPDEADIFVFCSEE